MVLKTVSLTPPILNIVQNKGTEPPFSGKYNDFGEPGTYLCRQCGLALFRANDKFPSACGWPSFDEELPQAVAHKLDRDGIRMEILCLRCQAHLGHLFEGEAFTERNKRYCVNSLSVEHVAQTDVIDSEELILAGGCFWGVEYLLKQLNGILKTEVGYTGGAKPHPSYEQVCTGQTGHYEAVRVLYDPQKITADQILKTFFEIHDPTQEGGQGPDHGSQYLSVVFYYDAAQKQMEEKIINKLNGLGYKVRTQILPVSTFWPAEVYHQDYYRKTNKQPYCHRYIKKFD